MKKSLSLVAALIAGIFFPKAAAFSNLIYYLLIAMLFISLIECNLQLEIFQHKKIYALLGVNIAIGLFGYFLFRNIDKSLALSAFLVGITPTATACPSVISFLKGKVDFAIAAVIITNIFMSCFLPCVIFCIAEQNIDMCSIFLKSVSVIVVPLFAGKIVRASFSQIYQFFVKRKSISFYLWLVVCFLAVSKASSYIQANSSGFGETLPVAFIAASICIANFSLGRQFGGKSYSLEMSQTLGQKNTTLTIWIGLTYFDPLISLGPIFYLIYHNIYNCYQLAIAEKRYRSGASVLIR